jgi:hypothetical protein
MHFPSSPSPIQAPQRRLQVGGKISIRGRSAIIRPENEELLRTIRQHPQLKGYIEPGAPPGYLLIKATSRPDNFVRCCRALGFEIDLL